MPNADDGVYHPEKHYIKITVDIIDRTPRTQITYWWSNQVEPWLQDLLHHVYHTERGRPQINVNRKVVIERTNGGSVTWMRNDDNVG